MAIEGNLKIFLLILSVGLLSWTVIYICLHWVAIICGRLWLHSKKLTWSHAKEVPGVSIVKPLCGYDATMKENLQSFFELDYPKFELMLCVGEPENGPSLPVIEELMRKHPSVDVKIFQGGETVGPNNKINNMMPGYQNAQYPLVWISDSSIYTPADNLKEMTSHICDPKVALVHQLPFVGPVQGFAGYLDKVYFGTQHSRMYLLSHLLKQNCVNGMSWLLNKHALDEEGGLKAFSEYLAEDYFMAQALMDRGWKFALSSKPAVQNQANRSTTAYRIRVTRWTKLRAAMVPFPGLLEPLVECFFVATMGSLSTQFLFGSHFFLFFFVYSTLWFFSDLMLIRTIANGSVGKVWLVLPAWLYREITTYWCFFSGIINREVNWRGKRYRLLLGGKAVRIDAPSDQIV